MANPKLPDPKHVQYAHDEMAKGRSSREVAAELATLGVPVSHMTVARWAKQWPAQQARAAEPGPMVAPAVRPPPARASVAPRPNPLAAEIEARKAATPPAPPVEELEAASEDDLELILRQEVSYLKKEIDRHKGTREDMSARASDRLLKVLEALRKLETKRERDKTVISFSREELRDATRTLLERVINPLRALDGKPPVPAETLL